MVVAHNMAALNAQRQYGINLKSKTKVAEQLSSGYKINRAADDAAGLSISEKMRRQIKGLSRGVKNAQDGVSLCQVADGALTEVNAMLQRISELSVQSANGTNSNSDRDAIQAEVDQILTEIDRISESTKFNEKYIFAKEVEEKIEIDPVVYRNAIRQSLLDGTAERVANDVVLDDGSVLAAEDANAIIALMSNYVISGELVEGSYSYPQDNNIISEYVERANNNSLLMVKYTDGTTYESDMQKSYRRFEAGFGYPSAAVLHEASSLYNEVCRDAYNKVPKERVAEMTASAMQEIVNYVRTMDDSLRDGIAGDMKDYAEWAASNFADATNFLLEEISITSGDTYDLIAAFGNHYGSGSGRLDVENAIDVYLSLFPKTETEPNKTVNGVWIQSGCDVGDGIFLRIDPMNTHLLGIDEVDVTSIEGADKAMVAVEEALIRLSANRSKIGAQQNRLEHTIDNENNIIENTTVAESRIRDTDMAKSMVQLSKENILEQVGQSMLAQANQATQGVMSLLQ